MEKVTGRNVVSVALRLLSFALFVGAIASAGFLIIDYASVIGLGANISWGSFVALFLFLSVAPAFAAIAVWKAANRLRRGGPGSIQ